MINKKYQWLVKIFEDYNKNQERVSGKKTTVRDFDVWCGGFVSGFTCKKTTKNYTKEEIQEIKDMIDTLVKSKIAKSIGVTGTEKEELIVIKI